MKEFKIDNEEMFFGPLLPYIRDDDITDINWNGTQLWLDNLKKGRYLEDSVKLDSKFVKTFTSNISNIVSKNFNKSNPLVEAETDSLRVSILHPDVAKTGTSISIRKTPAKRRLSTKSMIETGYCTQEIDDLMQALVHAHCNIVVCGLPGVGKTEYVKMLTDYIPANERAITIEDNLEVRYKEINPGKDCVSLKVEEGIFSYTDAIKACLRQDPVWILLSEARSTEVKYLLESMSSGTHCLTTIHADDTWKIPNRIKNMMPAGVSDARVEDDIYSFIDVGVLIQSKFTPEGIKRCLSQVSFYVSDEKTKEHKIIRVYEDGQMLINKLPAEIERKFKMAGVPLPFRKEK